MPSTVAPAPTPEYDTLAPSAPGNRFNTAAPVDESRNIGPFQVWQVVALIIVCIAMCGLLIWVGLKINEHLKEKRMRQGPPTPTNIFDRKKLRDRVRREKDDFDKRISAIEA